jgi:hypothetical protein
MSRLRAASAGPEPSYPQVIPVGLCLGTCVTRPAALPSAVSTMIARPPAPDPIPWYQTSGSAESLVIAMVRF